MSEPIRPVGPRLGPERIAPVAFERVTPDERERRRRDGEERRRKNGGPERPPAPGSTIDIRA